MAELFTEEDVRALAIKCWTATWGEKPDDDESLRISQGYVRVILSALAEDGRLRADDELSRAYWKIREHASAYRATRGFLKAREEQEADRDNEVKRTRYVLHEWFARGIEAAARDVAELIGVPEHEIDEPAESGGCECMAHRRPADSESNP